MELMSLCQFQTKTHPDASYHTVIPYTSCKPKLFFPTTPRPNRFIGPSPLDIFNLKNHK